MLVSAFALASCNDLYSLLFGPTADEQARNCGVSVEQLKSTKTRVENMRPYRGADLGRCSVIKDDSGIVVAFRGNEVAAESAAKP